MRVARFAGFLVLMTGLMAGAACLSVDGQDDQFPPTVRFVTPENGATVSGEVQVDIEATDDTGILLVRFFRNNLLAGQTQIPPYRFIWNTTAFVDGEVPLLAEAVDLAGNRAVTEIRVTVQNAGKAGGVTPD